MNKSDVFNRPMHAGLPCLIAYKIRKRKKVGRSRRENREGAFYAPLMSAESHIWFLQAGKNSAKDWSGVSDLLVNSSNSLVGGWVSVTNNFFFVLFFVFLNLSQGCLYAKPNISIQNLRDLKSVIQIQNSLGMKNCSGPYLHVWLEWMVVQVRRDGGCSAKADRESL